MIDTFSRVSGLTVNHSKSSLIPFNLTDHEIQMAQLITHINIQALQITYLGLPLTVLKPTRDLYLSLIEMIEHKLEGWQGKLIFRGEGLNWLTLFYPPSRYTS
jgi:hypothetical protein